MVDSFGETGVAAGFHNALAPGHRPVLLVVDMVQAYFEPTSPLYARVEDARDASLALIAAARVAQVPVLYTSVSYAAGGANGGVFFRKLPALQVFEPDSPLGAFADGIAPGPGELVIDKQYPSAFFGTSLAATLTAGGIDTVMICGLTTSGCVRASVVDAMCHGFIPLVVREAVGDRTSAVHEANLFDMSAKYADVVGLSKAKAYLETPHQPSERMSERFG